MQGAYNLKMTVTTKNKTKGTKRNKRGQKTEHITGGGKRVNVK